jgi:flagellar FliL protein
MSIELELSEEALRHEIMTRLPQIRNALLMIIPNKKFEDIVDSEGKEALREEMLTAMNEYLTKGEVMNIYYTEFVIQ